MINLLLMLLFSCNTNNKFEKLNISNNGNRAQKNILEIPSTWVGSYEDDYEIMTFSKKHYPSNVIDLLNSKYYEICPPYYYLKFIQFEKNKPIYESDIAIKPVSDSVCHVLQFFYPFKKGTITHYEDTSKWVVLLSIETKYGYDSCLTYIPPKEKILSVVDGFKLLNDWLILEPTSPTRPNIKP
ncbi:hypothetical protein [Flammeovirga aprica]|uniref:hypothetical protein n=1 Tax=Flammeovirga aprica TaxID=29528 RepID=UPI00198093CC|nr:hypothetical protein [Flammeovirga aprica]